jgi:hypothetical protein
MFQRVLRSAPGGRPRGVVHLRDEGGDAAGDLTRDQHRDGVRGRQQDRHEGIPPGELLTGADIDKRLTLAAPRLGIHDIVLTNHESPASVAHAQRVVLEHDVVAIGTACWCGLTAGRPLPSTYAPCPRSGHPSVDR